MFGIFFIVFIVVGFCGIEGVVDKFVFGIIDLVFICVDGVKEDVDMFKGIIDDVIKEYFFKFFFSV